MDKQVIWQGELHSIVQDHVHRIVQVAADDCIVEMRWMHAEDPDEWEAEEDDEDCARAYMRALLEERAAASAEAYAHNQLHGIIFEVWKNEDGVPVCLSTPVNMLRLRAMFEDGETPMLSFVAKSWEEATEYYKQLQQDCWP
jgi:hypothetical protein